MLGSICVSVHDLYGYRSILSNLQEPCTGGGWFGGLVWDSSCEAPVQKLTATSHRSFADHFTSMPGHHYQGCAPIRQCHQCLVRLRTTSLLLSFERMPNPSFVVDHPPNQSSNCIVSSLGHAVGLTGTGVMIRVSQGISRRGWDIHIS